MQNPRNSGVKVFSGESLCSIPISFLSVSLVYLIVFLLWIVLLTENLICLFARRNDINSIISNRWRNVILGSFLWILMICWFSCIALVDLHNVKFSKYPIVWCYKMTSYWLNLTWTLAVCFLTKLFILDLLVYS